MTRDEVDRFEKLKAQLDSLYQEMSMLAKKSPDGATNAFKIRFVNDTLKQCNDLFGAKYRPFEDFAEFATDELPTNSDVIFIVSQYLECAEKLRADNVWQVSFNEWNWVVRGSSEKVRTSPPKKINDK